MAVVVICEPNPYLSCSFRCLLSESQSQSQSLCCYDSLSPPTIHEPYLIPLTLLPTLFLPISPPFPSSLLSDLTLSLSPISQSAMADGKVNLPDDLLTTDSRFSPEGNFNLQFLNQRISIAIFVLIFACLKLLFSWIR